MALIQRSIVQLHAEYGLSPSASKVRLGQAMTPRPPPRGGEESHREDQISFRSNYAFTGCTHPH